VTEDLHKLFDPLIGYVLPGLMTLYGLSFYVPVIGVWFGLAAEKETTIGGFFFVVLASLGIGLVVSGLRCLVIDEYCMPKKPQFNYANRKNDNDSALADIRSNHYVYYQFYSNTLCALVVTLFLWHHAVRPPWSTWGGVASAMIVASVVLYFSARDCLKKYDEKTKGILGLVTPPARRERE